MIAASRDVAARACGFRMLSRGRPRAGLANRDEVRLARLPMYFLLGEGR